MTQNSFNTMRNYFIPLLLLVIVSVSLLTLYGSVSVKTGIWKDNVFIRQFFWVILGWFAYFVFSNIYYRRLSNFIYPFYALVVILLILVLIFGGVRLGAQRWIKVWWFNFQPSEFAKLAVLFILSHYFSSKGAGEIRRDGAALSFFRGLVLPFLIILPILGLILKQPDLGTAILILFIFLGLVYFAGVKGRYILLIAAVGLILSPLFWHFLKDYQKDRITVFLNPNLDPLGAGYTIIQSKIAIGSGRLAGKGLFSGTQGALNFLPESHTDFIFGIFAEENGFFGCVILLCVYYLLIHRVISIGARASDNFARLFASGAGFMLAIQIYINISMTLGASPVVGLPLPLMSYGGSSMLVNFISLGIVQNINRRG